MSLLLNTGAMHYRENANEEWKPLVIKADVDIESLADPYSPLSTYSVGEYCTHDGKAYRCISTISTAEAWNSSHWQETTIGQELESINYVRPNLLDNWYFAGNGSQNGNFPINQRGQEYYTNAGVTIDRWFKGTNGAINSITKAYGLLITPNTALYQKLSTDTKDALDGKTCTLTLLTNDGKIRSGTFVYKSAPSSTITILNVAGVVKFECGIDGNIYITWLSSFNTGYFAIKLELGDTQTLAHQENGVWVLNEIPNFADELARCKRYYNKFPVETYLSGVYRPTEGAIRLTINESVNQNVSLGMSEFCVLTEAGGIQGSYVPTSIARTYWSPTAFTVDITSSFTSAACTPVTLLIVNGTINADL